MDDRTIKYYNKHAKDYADLSFKRRPERLYNVAKAFFKPQGKTLDLGCGSGRDTIELSLQGFNAHGIDAASNLLDEAKLRTPDSNLKFEADSLPHLRSIKDGTLDNIFCSGVLMHLPQEILLNSLTRMIEVLNPSGRLLLSWRNSTDGLEREAGEDRLFMKYSGEQIMLLLRSLGCEILFYSYEYSDPTRPNVPWYIVVAGKNAQAHSGLSKVQSYILNDAKTSTYKLALLRALVQLAQFEPHIAQFEKKENDFFARIPINNISIKWAQYYWGLAAHKIKQTSLGALSVYSVLSEKEVTLEDVLQLNEAQDTKGILKKLSQIIINNPVRYLGGHGAAGFFHRDGFLHIPIDVWRDMIIFGHWIENSILIEWTELTFRLNDQRETLGHYFDIIKKDYIAERDQAATGLVRNVLNHGRIFDTWTGQPLNQYVIDHILPFSALRIDHLWNLTPTNAVLNSKKSDSIPSAKQISKSKERIKGIWAQLAERHEQRFFRELKVGLNVMDSDFNENIAIDALIERSSHLVNIRGYKYWDFDLTGSQT